MDIARVKVNRENYLNSRDIKTVDLKFEIEPVKDGLVEEEQTFKEVDYPISS